MKGAGNSGRRVEVAVACNGGKLGKLVAAENDGSRRPEKLWAVGNGDRQAEAVAASLDSSPAKVARAGNDERLEEVATAGDGGRSWY